MSAYNATFDKYGYDETAYIRMEVKSGELGSLIVDFSCMFGSLGGHGYTFEFSRDPDGKLRAKGRYDWVS